MKIVVIGMGYVGLPLALLLSKKNNVIGFDINSYKIKQLNKNIDETNEINKKTFEAGRKILFTNDPVHIKNADFFIIAVPTPIKKNKEPDLRFLKKATILAAKNIKNQSVVILESTVFPGTTEDICVPIIKKISKLKYINKDSYSNNVNGFYCGFCPERVNPGDKKHTIDKITKVISGSNNHAIKKIKNLYKSICKKIYISNSIKTAEAAKIIENTQRDLNIALINELSKIFRLLKLDTREVLATAGTKWNFSKYFPGMVGGHCIGVDPYYLTYKSKNIGFKPNVILAGRKINDGMTNYILKNIIRIHKDKNISLFKSKILFIGCSFKENVTDTRNSKSIELIKKLNILKAKIDIFDQVINEKKILDKNVIKSFENLNKNYYDAIIFSVTHDRFKDLLKKNYKKFLKTKKNIVIDINGFLPKESSDFRL
ncbi:nucleotide sugar dehydrogenase [Candidatus Pelagibacter sp.]|nr:nucleotide sugar dehydrogenase [Candidatus Pelagibacter sp.]